MTRRLSTILILLCLLLVMIFSVTSAFFFHWHAATKPAPSLKPPETVLEQSYEGLGPLINALQSPCSHGLPWFETTIWRGDAENFEAHLRNIAILKGWYLPSLNCGYLNFHVVLSESDLILLNDLSHDPIAWLTKHRQAVAASPFSETRRVPVNAVIAVRATNPNAMKVFGGSFSAFSAVISMLALLVLIAFREKSKTATQSSSEAVPSRRTRPTI